MQRMTLTIIGLLLLLAGCDEFLPPPTITVPDNFEPDEQWICRDSLDISWSAPSRSSGEPNVAVALLADFDAGVGSIEIGGSAATAEYTRFQIEGLDRRWDWCPRSGGILRCSFTIDPTGDGRYYKFAPGEKETKASGLYKCSTVEAWKAEHSVHRGPRINRSTP